MNIHSFLPVRAGQRAGALAGLVFDTDVFSDNPNRHSLDAVVAVAEPIPFRSLGLSSSGQVGGACPDGDDAGLV